MFNPALSTRPAQTLAQALALILVGMPIFLFHWSWLQRTAGREEDEKASLLRPVFLYGTLLATLIPLAQNLLALINRLFLGATHLTRESAILGSAQTWSDNLIAILLNGLVAFYFWNILRGEWQDLPESENLRDVRRLYRFIWVLYGLLMTVFGIQQILRYVLYTPTETFGSLGREMVVNGLALLVIGLPIWASMWQTCQNALTEPAERTSLLRLGILYLLTFGGVAVALAAGGNVLYTMLWRLLGEPLSSKELLNRLGGPLSIGIPFGVVWAYYGHWLEKQIQVETQAPRQAGLKRLYFYILSATGLTVTFIGLSLLFSFLIDLATTLPTLFSTGFWRSRLAGALATLLIGLPLWLQTWRPMQAEATQEGDLGDHARRSILRKTYLYLALFVSVIGGMVAAVVMVYRILVALLSGEAGSDFLQNVLNPLQNLGLFVLVLVYHLSALRQDQASRAGVLAQKQGQFPVLIFDPDGNFGATMRAAFARLAPNIPLTVLKAEAEIDATLQAKAVILPGSLALQPPAALERWLRQFNGIRLIVPDEAAGVFWGSDSGQIAQIARALAEGQEIRPLSSRRTPAWKIVAYVFAAFFALEIFFSLITLTISALVN
ncbi:MAG: DUF5671 domain-containing protein, partial [Anaerolineae bacterium]